LVGSSLRSQTRFVARTIKGAKPLGVNRPIKIPSGVSFGLQ
jgi:hypothetical protein